MKDPDFYLVLNDAIVLELPLECRVRRTLTFYQSSDSLLVEVHPPINYENGTKKVFKLREIVLVVRHKGVTLSEIETGPVYVNVVMPIVDLTPETTIMKTSEGQIIALGVVYRNMDEAEKAARKAFKEYTGEFWKY